MSTDRNVVIVGGGIWGFSTAFHLAKRGVKNVRVVERNAEAANETTPRAAGLVGQIRSSKTMCDAIRYALDLFGNFKEETGHDPGMNRSGSLLVAMSPERMLAYQHQVETANANGVQAEFVSHAEMQRLAPAIDVAQFEGGYFVTGDGYLDPRQCALALASAAQDLGVRVDFSTTVNGLSFDGNRVVGVTTDREDFPADAVVITAGPWTGQLVKSAEYDLPMQVIRHQRAVTVPCEGIPSHHPVVRVTDVSCYLRPEKGGYLYGFFEPQPTAIELDQKSPEFRTADLAVPYETMSEARRRMSKAFPILASLDIAEHWQGMTTFAPDGRYLIGKVPEYDNLYAASGCAALGIAGSAAVGNWIAESVATGTAPAELTEFNAERFGEQAGDRDWVRRESLEFYANYYGLPSP